MARKKKIKKEKLEEEEKPKKSFFTKLKQFIRSLLKR